MSDVNRVSRAVPKISYKPDTALLAIVRNAAFKRFLKTQPEKWGNTLVSLIPTAQTPQAKALKDIDKLRTKVLVDVAKEPVIKLLLSAITVYGKAVALSNRTIDRDVVAHAEAYAEWETLRPSVQARRGRALVADAAALLARLPRKTGPQYTGVLRRGEAVMDRMTSIVEFKIPDVVVAPPALVDAFTQLVELQKVNRDAKWRWPKVKHTSPEELLAFIKVTGKKGKLLIGDLIDRPARLAYALKAIAGLPDNTIEATKALDSLRSRAVAAQAAVAKLHDQYTGVKGSGAEVFGSTPAKAKAKPATKPAAKATKPEKQAGKVPNIDAMHIHLLAAAFEVESLTKRELKKVQYKPYTTAVTVHSEDFPDVVGRIDDEIAVAGGSDLAALKEWMASKFERYAAEPGVGSDADNAAEPVKKPRK